MPRAVALLVLALALTAAPGAQAAGRCKVPRRARVQARTQRVVLYTIEQRRSRYEQLYGELVGCLEAVGKRIGIESLIRNKNGSPGLWVSGIVLNGYQLAYAHHGGGSYLDVRFLDLRHPRLRFSASTVQGSELRVPRLVLTSDGALAYTIAWVGSRDRAAHKEVRARDRDGPRTLGRGAGVDLQSLARHGRTVTWTDSGQRRTALLAHMGRFAGCKLPVGAEVRTYDRDTVVYTQDHVSQYYEGTTVAYACARQTGRRQTIGLAEHDVNDEEFDDNFRIAGRYVAWGFRYYDHYGGEGEDIVVIDLVERRRAYTVYAAGRAPDEVGPDPVIVRLLVSRNGDIAWTTRTYVYGIQDYDSGPIAVRRLVSEHDQFGPVQLDEGTGVGLTSLRLSGGRVHWTRNGVERSARMWPSAHRVNCSLPPGAELLNRTVTSVAYRYDTGAKPDMVRHSYGCFLASGRRTHLGKGKHGVSRVLDVQLAGRYAAFGMHRLDRAHDAQRLIVRSVDLRTGRDKWSSLAGDNPGGQRVGFTLPKVTLAPTGGFAYVVVTHDHAHPNRYGGVGRVRVRCAGGDITVDEGTAIYAPDLSFDGRVVRWWADNAWHSRDLSGAC